MTSAGVRMAQETSSAREEAAAWMTGVGRRPWGCEEVELRLWKRDLVRSYVVKKAPAGGCHQHHCICVIQSFQLFSHNEIMLIHDGSVAIITLPTPWYMPLNNAGLGFPVAEFV